MFWMTAASAALACFPEARVLTSVAMLSAIWVKTGKSCNARLIHCALHPVAAIVIASTRARRGFDLELGFMFSPARQSLVVAFCRTGPSHFSVILSGESVSRTRDTFAVEEPAVRRCQSWCRREFSRRRSWENSARPPGLCDAPRGPSAAFATRMTQLRSEVVTKFIWQGCWCLVGFEAQSHGVRKAGRVS